MTIPKLIVVNNKTQPMTRQQAQFFDDNGFEDSDLMAFNDPWWSDVLDEDNGDTE